MPFDLRGRNVLITAGSRGLGALIAQKFAKKGANVAINYFSNKDAAVKVENEIKSIAPGVKTVLIQGDAGVQADVRNIVQTAIKELGGLDVIIGNAGYTEFSQFDDLDAMSNESWDRCWHTNVTGQMWLLREALPTFNANPEGGAFIVTSSVAGTSQSGSSMPYSVTKAAQIHLIKCLAQTQGPKVRVNAILPGLLLTDWGNRYSEERLAATKNRAALKRETFLDDCAEMFIVVAENTSMTGQKITVDAGLNIVGS